MRDGFNSNFYITTATVIPLFYITLFLQSQVMQNLALRYSRAFFAYVGGIGRWTRRASGTWRYVRLLLGALAGMAAFPLTYAIVFVPFAGVIAEWYSLWALYHQSDTAAWRLFVLWSGLGLLVIVSANPTLTIYRNVLGLRPSDESAEKPASSEGKSTDKAKEDEKTSTGLGWPPSD